MSAFTKERPSVFLDSELRQMINGNCLTTIRGIQDRSINLVVTSPPYGMGKAYDEDKTAQQCLDRLSPLVPELHRVLADNGSVCWQVGSWTRNSVLVPLDALWYPVFIKAGFTLRNRIVWTFGHGEHSKRRFSGRHETILWFTKSDDYVFNLDPVRVPQLYPNKKAYRGPRKGELSCNPLGKNPGDVWDITNVKHGHPEKTCHPCQFPEELVSRCILALTNPGGVVLDPFAGSGTTGVVAQTTGRYFIGIEKDPHYVSIATDRIARGRSTGGTE